MDRIRFSPEARARPESRSSGNGGYFSKNEVIMAQCWRHSLRAKVNLLTPNDPYRGRTALLTSESFILYIYSTNICTEYFKHGVYPPLFSLQNAVCFIILTYLVPVLFTFYIQDELKFKKNNSGAKRLKLTRKRTAIHKRMHNRKKHP